MPSRSLETPTGTFSLWEEDGAITRANWGPAEDAVSDLLDEAASQIEAYFIGTRTEFELPLKLKGVLGATSLGGFSGKFGIETKVELLKHEGAASLLI